MIQGMVQAEARGRRPALRSLVDQLGIVAILILLCLVFAVATPTFFTFSNIINVATQSSINAILAAGMTFVILTGGIDLSVGAIVAVAGVMVVFLSGYVPAPLAILGAILVGAAAGYVNGVLTAATKLPSIIVTLGSMTYLRGIAYVITGGYPLVLSSTFIQNLGIGRVGNIPVPIFFMIVVFGVSYVILRYTVFGRNVYMIGGNMEAARLSGIKLVPRLTVVYVISGVCSAVAGVILAARLFSGQPNAGLGYELNAIAAVVLGGTSLTGGVGTVIGSLFGALFIGVLQNGLTLLNVNYYWQLIVQGIVIVIAVYIDHLRRRSSTRSS